MVRSVRPKYPAYGGGSANDPKRAQHLRMGQRVDGVPLMSCRSSSRPHIDLIGGYRGEPQFCRDRVDSLLRDGEVDLSVGGEVRTYVPFVVLLHFVPCQPVEERAEV